MKKQALHLAKGDILLGPKGQKAKVETVIFRDDMRNVEVTVREGEGKRIINLRWTDMVELWSPPKKDRRYRFLVWLGKMLRAPVKRA